MGRSHVWVRKQIDNAETKVQTLSPESIVLALDTTFWGRQYGVSVLRSPKLKKNLWWQEVTQETPEIYRQGKEELEKQGWTIEAVVIDGKAGVARVFSNIPVQLCQFHQMKTVTKYLTRKPKTQAGWELRQITLTLARTSEVEFTNKLNAWHERWQTFLSERTPCPCCKPNCWPYTHRKLRAAYRSLKTNLPFLFTYQRYPELNIPNTTNCLDGMFSQIKNRLAVHRGLRQDRRYKIIGEILGGKEGN